MLPFAIPYPVYVPPARYAKSFTSDASGVWTGTVPASMLWRVQPMTPGEFNNSIALVGTTCTVTFRKFKSAGLGITLGTLLTVSVFEDNTGAVTFSLFGEPAT